MGKTALLERLGTHTVVYLDDIASRQLATQNPRLFLDQLPKKLVLDEASLAPELFLEVKRRVDEQRRARASAESIDYWITGSNQTLLQKNVQESLAGRASYFDLNTLSIHELGQAWRLDASLLRGGWPELYVTPELGHVRYLNDLLATFIERDIVGAAGIEKKAAFSKALQLLAGRVGCLFNASDIAMNVGVEATTIQSWFTILENNGILMQIRPYFTNTNKRLIKSPKYYFEDVALATRLQGWSDYQPLSSSPLFGHLVENLAYTELSRFFTNRGAPKQIYFLRSKEKVEIDFLVQLSNQRYVAIEVKVSPEPFTRPQIALLDSLDITIVERWVVSPQSAVGLDNARSIAFNQIWDELNILERE